MRHIIAALMAVSLAACSSTPTGGNWDVNRQASPAPGLSKSPLDTALSCVAEHRPEGFDVPKIGVNQVTNSTGVFDYEGAGNYLPVDAGHMFITALWDAGFRVVTRQGETVQALEWELNYAMQKVLGDGEMHTIMDISQPEGRTREIPYRVVQSGVLLGSDLLLVGSINRLDFDTSSGGLEVYVNGYSIGRRSYSALVGMDVALVDTRSTEIIWAETYAKEYIGIENKAGVFRFEGNSNLVDVNFGIQSNDPLQAGLQDMVNFAAFDMARTLFKVGDFCDSHLDRNHSWQDLDVMRRAPAGAKYSK